MNSAQHTILAITTVVVAKIQFAIVALAQLYDPSVAVLLGVQLVLGLGLSTVSTVAWTPDAVLWNVDGVSPEALGSSHFLGDASTDAVESGISACHDNGVVTKLISLIGFRCTSLSNSNPIYE